MVVRADVRLPSLSKSRGKELEASLRDLAEVCPKRDVWILTLMEHDAGEWLMLATGGAEPSDSRGWAFVGMERDGAEAIRTYARAFQGEERGSGFIVEAARRFLRAAAGSKTAS